MSLLTSPFRTVLNQCGIIADECAEYVAQDAPENAVQERIALSSTNDVAKICALAHDATRYIRNMPCFLHTMPSSPRPVPPSTNPIWATAVRDDRSLKLVASGASFANIFFFFASLILRADSVAWDHCHSE